MTTATKSRPSFKAIDQFIDAFQTCGACSSLLPEPVYDGQGASALQQCVTCAAWHIRAMYRETVLNFVHLDTFTRGVSDRFFSVKYLVEKCGSLTHTVRMHGWINAAQDVVQWG